MNISLIASPLPIPSKDNQSSLLNITDDSWLVQINLKVIESKITSTALTGDETSASQDPPYTNASRAVPSEIIDDTIRNKATKIATELAKGALNEAEQALNTAKVSANRNLSLATDVTKSSEQSVNHGGQIPSNTIDRDNEQGMPIKYQLAQEAKTQIDRAWKGLDTKFGNSVTNMETADNPNSEFKPDTQDVSRSSSIIHRPPDLLESNSKIDNNTPENQLRTPPPPHHSQVNRMFLQYHPP